MKKISFQAKYLTLLRNKREHFAEITKEKRKPASKMKMAFAEDSRGFQRNCDRIIFYKKLEGHHKFEDDDAIFKVVNFSMYQTKCDNKKELLYYKCQMCPYISSQKCAVRKHFFIHTGLRPHQCPQCGKTFVKLYHLKRHVLVHTGDRPYACKHCESRFARKESLQVHCRMHSGKHHFQCFQCDESFRDADDLKTHIESHADLNSELASLESFI